MTDNIINFPGETRLDLPPERVITAALGQVFDQLLIIGITEDGNFYFSGTTGNVADVNMIVDRAKKLVMEWL